jgi:hypothetical protein
MKKILIFSFIALGFLASCNKPDLIDNDKQVGISKITYYPIMTVKGAAFMSIAKGTAFSDPGVSAVAGTATVPVTTAGTVDATTAGVYTLTYTAVNVDGFSVSSSRIVCVYDATAAANDFSGNYARSTNGSVAVWTKVAPGMYTVFNPGGAPGTNLTIHVFNPTGFILRVPSQVSSDGSITSCTTPSGGANITYNPGPPAQYVWIVLNPGYGTGVRTFNKQ